MRKKTKGRKIQIVKLIDGTIKCINHNRRITTNKFGKQHIFSRT